MTTNTTRATLAIGICGSSIALLALAGCDRDRKDPSATTETRGATEPVASVQAPAAPPQPLGEGRGPAAAQGQAQAPAAESPEQGAGAGAQAGAQGNLPPFEGELKMNVAGKAPESFEYAMKGDKIRLGLSTTPGKNDKGIDAIIDTDDKKALVLLNNRKEYLEVDLGALATKAKARVENVRVENTGETDTVSGRECERWKIVDRDVRVNACVVKGAPYFDLAALEEQAGFRAPGWLHSVVDAGYVPLRVNFVDPKRGADGKVAGAEVADMSTNVDASRFDVPKDYKKTTADKLGVPGARKAK